VTGNRIIPWNQLLGLSFIAVADLLATYKTAGEPRHAAAIIGHTQSSKVFLFSTLDANTLQTRNICTISQLLEVDDLTGRLTIDEKRVL
jgi:hypothetical protein